MYERTDLMSDPPNYDKGDVVWVKLSGWWWPGEVKNEEDLPKGLLADFKKPPLVIVKFFEEDSYEYIKQWCNIHPYNCDKKTEFIKKGMVGYRAKLSHMDKFPRDIGVAEAKTNGNPDILSEPEFLPSKKMIYDDLFGSPSPKKSVKNKNASSSPRKNKPLITHRRFLGNDDYKAYILVQEIHIDRSTNNLANNDGKLNSQLSEVMKCDFCTFSTFNVDVMSVHNKWHCEDPTSTPKPKLKKFREYEFTDSEEPETSSPKPQKQRKKKVHQMKKSAYPFSNLLRDWSDSEEERPHKKKKSVKTPKHHGEKLTKPTSSKKAPKSKATQDDIKNCFDFDEEEEEDEILVPASSDRKIPRVIPEKSKDSIAESMEFSEKGDESQKDAEATKGENDNEKPTSVSENEKNESNVDKCDESVVEKSADPVEDPIESTFKELMEKTVVPSLDELAEDLKPEQNFHDARTIKFPDKGGTDSADLQPMKKSFVTSFDDFEAGFKKINAEQGLEEKVNKAMSTTESTDVSVNEEINNSVQNEDSEELDTSKLQKKRKQLIVEKDSDRIVEFSKDDDEMKDDLNKTPEEVKEQLIVADEIRSVEVDAELKTKTKRGRPQKNNADNKKADISVEIDTPVQTPRRGRSRKIEEFHLTAEDSEEIEPETKIDNDQPVDVIEKLVDEETLIKKDTTEKPQEDLVESVDPEKKNIVEHEKNACDAEILENKIKSSAIKNDDEAVVEIVSKKRRGRSSRWTNHTEEVKEPTKVEETASKPVEESDKFMESQEGFLVSTEKLDEEIKKTSLAEDSVILQNETSGVDKTDIIAATGNVSDTLYTGGSSRSLRSSKAIKSRWDKIATIENAASVDTSVVKETEIIEENAADKIEEKAAEKIEEKVADKIQEKVDLPVKKKRGRPKRNSSISKLDNSELEVSKGEMDYSTEDSQESLTDKEISLKESTEENSESAEFSQDGEIGNKKVNKKWRRGRRKKRIFKKAPAKNNEIAKKEVAETNADNNLIIEEKSPNEQNLDSLESSDESKKLQEEVKESKEVQNNQIIDESNSEKEEIKEKSEEEPVAIDSKDAIIEKVSSPKVTDATPRKRGRPKKIVQEPPEESTIKHSDSAILKINEEIKDKTDDDKTKNTLKVIPPKKHKWPLRSSRNNEDISIEAIEESSASETVVQSSCSNKSTNNIVDELILPLKKSKRANEALKDDEEELTLHDVDEKDVSVVSKKLKLDLEPKVSEEPSAEGVHPKKKKFYLETKVPEDIAETAASIAPKKKIQKLFETSQNVEKVEPPLMSPLAKKKNFLFQQQEVDLQKEEEVVAKNEEKSKNSSIAEEIESKKDKEDVEIEESKIETVPVPLEDEKIMNIDKDTTAMKLIEESELVSLSGTPTVMTEQDLADVQVEITTDKIISEFPAEKDIEKAIIPKCGTTKSELLDILEGNSNSSANSSGSDRAFKSSYDSYNKKNTVQEIIDFEDEIPSQIVQTNKVSADSVILDSPKLLERLSMSSDIAKNKAKVVIQSDIKVPEDISKNLMGKMGKTTSGMVPKPGQKIIIKSSRPGAAVLASNVQLGTKPLILSEQILRPGNLAIDTKAVQQGLKRQYEDIEDVETAFIIPKISKKTDEEVVATPPTSSKARNAKVPIGKATILQQTIIKPKIGEIIPQLTQPSSSSSSSSSTNQMEQDDSIFDINSMPIVLSDDLLTPESIQNMPVVLSNEILPQGPAVSTIKAIDKPLIQKKIIASVPAKQIILKTSQASFGTPTKFITKSKNVSSSTIKSGATAFLATGTTIDGQPAKYVLVPPSATPATTQVKTIKQTIVKKSSSSAVVGNLVKAGGSNVMGHQARLVLTPQQQKALLQPGTKTTKTMIKCPSLSKALLESVTTAGKTIISSKVVGVPYQLGTTSSPSVAASGSALRTIKNVVTTATPNKKIPPVQRPIANKPQKTILIKNSLGTTVRKVQGTDDADIDRQVAEQLKAIKASTRMHEANKSELGGFAANKPTATTTNVNKSTPIRKTFIKKPEPVKGKFVATNLLPEDALLQKDAAIPALAPLSPHARTSQLQKQTIVRKTIEQAAAGRSSLSKSPQKPSSSSLVQHKDKAPQTSSSDAEKRSESPVKQVVIQDGLGNLTTVTVGQILAIPSETVDGQPQSYMLVTVDESGNLTPLNNEALMSLDPSLRAGGDINNMVLQVDQGQGTVTSIKPSEISNTDGKKKIEEKPKTESKLVKQQTTTSSAKSSKPEVNEQATGHQLIITGDSQVTQKFLDSLSDGTTDLASILESAEGGSVIIQADGQEILISTNTSDQSSLLEHHQESVFEAHKPNQDILAAALANTDVFQPIVDSHQHHLQSQSSVIKDLPTQIISPSSSGLYPVQAGNVSETSLTLTSPIMSPLEIPSTNTKKINDEVDILSQVSKNVDLPITITDPTIVQTVANQQAASSVGLMELTLPLPESSMSSGLNSPYSYSLPMLDESVVGNQKGFSSSMPLLTEDVVEGSLSADNDEMKNTTSSLSPNFGCLPILDSMDTSREEVVESLPILTENVVVEDTSNNKVLNKLATTVVDRNIVEEGLLTLGGEMCSSLSEPPPDMFDLSTISNKEDEISSDLSSIVEPEETLSMNSENSEEIPIQPPIVAALSDLKRSGDEEYANSESSEEKKARFEE